MKSNDGKKQRRKGSSKEVRHLSLNLHREFFNEIYYGFKTEEYREDSDYWRRRLAGRNYTEVHFRNGYATKAPFMRVQFKGVKRQRGQFVISLGKILEVKNYRGI